MSTNLSNYLEQLDFLGGHLTFYHNNKLRKRSTFGAIMSFMVCFIGVTFALIFGSDFYLRLNPKTIHETLFENKHSTYTINNLNFSIAVRFEDISGSSIYNETIFYIEAYHYHGIHGMNDQGFNMTVTPIPLNKCTPDYFAPNRTFKGYESWLCPKLDNVLFGGGWLSSQIDYLEFIFYECQEGKMNPKNQTCQKKEVTQKYYENLVFFDTGYIQKVIETTNFDKGIDYSFDYSWERLNPTYSKNKFFYFETVELVTDVGWLFKSLTYNQILSLDHYDKELIEEIEDPNVNKVKGKSLIFLSKKKSKIRRIYSKLQSFMAEVGGLMEFLYVSGFIIISTYNNIDFKFKFLSYVIHDKNLEEEIKPISKNKIDLIHFNKINKINNYNLNQPSETDNINNNNTTQNKIKISDPLENHNGCKSKDSKQRRLSGPMNIDFISTKNKENEEIATSLNSKRVLNKKNQINSINHIYTSNKVLNSESPTCLKNFKKVNKKCSSKSLDSSKYLDFDNCTFIENNYSSYLQKTKKQLGCIQDIQNMNIVNASGSFRTFKYIFFKLLSFCFRDTQKSLKIKLIDNLFKKIEINFDIMTLFSNNIRIKCISNFFMDQKKFEDKNKDDILSGDSFNHKVNFESELIKEISKLS